MEIVRYVKRSGRVVDAGVRANGKVYALPDVDTIAGLLRLPLSTVRGLVERAASGEGVPEADVLLLPPIDGNTEVWAAGVTYERSRAARVEESTEKSVYERVYDAERPELFLKAAAWRVVTDREPVAIRTDSPLNVPEPELGVVANAHGEIVGYFVCNDMSSRSIEGENPLYLPQAKIYSGSCAVSIGIRPAWEITDARALDITLTVVRDGEPAWTGKTSTGRMKRTLEDLVSYLFAGEQHPDGALLATGTGIIPEMSFTLAGGDRVDIEIAEVGTLSNQVVVGNQDFGFLVDALSDPFVRETVR